MSNFSIIFATSKTSSYPIVVTNLGGPRSRPNPLSRLIYSESEEDQTSLRNKVSHAYIEKPEDSWLLYMLKRNISLKYYEGLHSFPPRTDCFQLKYVFKDPLKGKVEQIFFFFFVVFPPVIVLFSINNLINTFKYHVFAPMGRFQLELILTNNLMFIICSLWCAFGFSVTCRTLILKQVFF